MGSINDAGIEMQSTSKIHLKDSELNWDEKSFQETGHVLLHPDSHSQVAPLELLHLLNFSDGSLWSNETNIRCIAILLTLSL